MCSSQSSANNNNIENNIKERLKLAKYAISHSWEAVKYT
jgi:hypothetical protein